MAQPEPNSTVEQLLADAVRARAAGDLATAEERYREVVDRDPRHAGALHNLGMIATLSGQLRQAVLWYERALAANPDAAATHNNLGAAYKDLGEPGHAIVHLTAAVGLQPGYAAAHSNLGSAFMTMNDAAGALPHFRRATELAPADAIAWLNLGRATFLAHGAAAAFAALQRAAALAPDSTEASAALGAALCTLGRFAEALPRLEEALAQRPDEIELLADVVHLRQHCCNWTDLDRNAARICEYVASAPQCGVSPFFFMALPGTTPHEQRRCAEQYVRSLTGGGFGRGEPPAFEFSRAPRRRLCIGYLIAHFHEHPMVRLMIGVLEHHDRERFEVVGLSCDRDAPAAVLDRARAALDDLLDLRAMTDDEAARAIHARGVDILVDGRGYGRGARPGVLALRPAPVQAAYLDYPGTTGADFIDYLIADRFVIPPGLADAYSERIKYLPNCYQCNDDRRVVLPPPERAECGLPGAGIVFCCFNQTYKIIPAVFDVWCRLLRAVPGSVLWLWASAGAAVENLCREARARDVAPARLVFARTAPAPQHLARLALADLFLDTLPFNAHTTASDALWAGVPVVTCAGETFGSRVAGSVLIAAGLPDLVTGSLAEYESLALRLARDPAALAAVRARVAESRRTMPLFDTARSTRDLEALYEEMWREYVVGK